MNTKVKEKLYKISDLEELILETLSGGVSLYGLEIINRIETGSKGSIKVTFGSLYPALRRLEDRSLLRSQWGEETPEERGGARRRYYQITKVGVETLSEKVRLRESISSYNRNLRPA